MHKMGGMALIKLINSRPEAPLNKRLVWISAAAEDTRCVHLKEPAIRCRVLFSRRCSVPGLR